MNTIDWQPLGQGYEARFELREDAVKYYVRNEGDVRSSFAQGVIRDADGSLYCDQYTMSTSHEMNPDLAAAVINLWSRQGLPLHAEPE